MLVAGPRTDSDGGTTPHPRPFLHALCLPNEPAFVLGTYVGKTNEETRAAFCLLLCRYGNCAHPCLQMIKKSPNLLFPTVCALFHQHFGCVRSAPLSILRAHRSTVFGGTAAAAPKQLVHPSRPRKRLCTSRVVHLPARASQAPTRVLHWRETSQPPKPGNKPLTEYKPRSPSSHKLRLETQWIGKHF